ncbi:SDR family oxidoreductase [Pseudomonas sp. RTC3]|uniref:UDP-glucose 4-epimerase family protein n=1 Tax=unclassified Pseudomonas TaxID=196821 RepID=UPI002AB5D635|nr:MULTISPECIES: SDR family oxidoreductase [unclassified Pseudomonas]MEB0064164.1 SDR family oxidoreductase [Pseudomonas sp. RTC3]MDY7565979.1 SDR family oxidoreductase [Pseudomonas sp. 5C2]MEB0007622.1 SDR family oxidoreductase [Pseudomonas sp. RTB2]MEB0018849.1 SDR family oxidoreductase [Pseudomonas sp. RTB3]MEB0239335.1 SDR family oxidoreductase [Pseudomonas sp. 5C2]
MRVLITGASGFVGSRLLTVLCTKDSYEIGAATRRDFFECPASVRVSRVTGLSPDTDWTEATRGVEVVVHTAARVHVMNDTFADPLAEFRKINVEGTLNLARQAVAAGVKRFVFVSSIKVQGELTLPGRAFSADDSPAPVDPYGVSKQEAEVGLRRLAAETGIEVVIIRPVLVYGPGVKANFLSMMRWLDKGIPLPFGAINNHRSLVALDNLVDLIVTCIEHPNAANQTFLVSDGEDLSTTELLLRMSQALGKSPRLLPIPSWVLKNAANWLGKTELSQRLCGSLQVDISKTRSVLGWTPPVSINEALKKTAVHFQECRE